MPDVSFPDTDVLPVLPAPARTGPGPDRHAWPMDGLRVVVTGGAGFIGSHVTARLADAGARVIVIDDLSARRVEHLSDLVPGRVRPRDFHPIDIRHADCAEVIAQTCPHIVIHLAAQTDLTTAQAMPGHDASVNIAGTVNVLEASRRAGVQQVVFAANAAIYGDVDPHLLPVTEDTPIAPTTTHGMSKATALDYLRRYHDLHGLPYLALAFGNVYGHGQPRPPHGVIARLAAAVVTGREPFITGHGTQTRDFLHVIDAADAVVRACRHPATGLLNIATGVETSINTVFDLVRRAAGVTTTAAYLPEPETPGLPAVGPHRIALDPRRAEQVLGWQPGIDLVSGIDAVVADQYLTKGTL